MALSGEDQFASLGVLISGYPSYLSWILLTSFICDFMFSWWMFLILDSISKTLHSLLMSEPVRNSLTLWNVEGLKAPLGFLMAALKGACSFLGLPKVLASGFVLEECNDTMGSYIRPALTSISGHERAQAACAGGLDFAGGKAASQEIITRSWLNELCPNSSRA